MLKSKLKAAGLHALITLLVGMTTAVLVFVLWYPASFAEMTGGLALFKLLLVVELILGPLMSLVIFNPQKQKQELIRDYSVVGAIQFVALIYGLYVVSTSRPVFLVFVKDRIEVVAATELRKADLRGAAPEFQSLPWLGPRFICVEMPTDPQEKSDLLMSALEGRDVQLLPKYYRECRDGEIAERAYDSDQFFSLTSLKSDVIPESLKGSPFTWFPVVTRFGAWVVLFAEGDAKKPVYVNADPFHQPDAIKAEDFTPPASTNPPPDNP